MQVSVQKYTRAARPRSSAGRGLGVEPLGGAGEGGHVALVEERRSLARNRGLVVGNGHLEGLFSITDLHGRFRRVAPPRPGERGHGRTSCCSRRETRSSSAVGLVTAVPAPCDQAGAATAGREAE